MRAFCWATGLVELGAFTPEGALPVMWGLKEDLKACLDKLAVPGNATKEKLNIDLKADLEVEDLTDTWLVPEIVAAGIRGDDNGAVDALTAFQMRCWLEPGVMP
jgi:hypothetical protein